MSATTEAPPGIEVLVKDGFATISAADPRTRNDVLNRLLATTPPEFIEKLTRSGPFALYRVPEGNAHEAGVISKSNTVDSLPDRVDLHFAQELADAHRQARMRAGA